MDKPLKFKVVVGSGPSQTIKRLSKTPEDYSELVQMVLKRLSDRLFVDHPFYIYYEDISNGMIKIEDDVDLRGAVEYCELYSKSSLKLFVHLEPLDISRVRTDYKEIDPDKLDEDENDDHEDSIDSEDSIDFEDDQEQVEENIENSNKKIAQQEVYNPEQPGEELPIQPDPKPHECLEEIEPGAQFLQNNHEDEDPFAMLIKDGKSNDGSQKDSNDGEDSDEVDYENHNPSFLQIPDDNEEDSNSSEDEPVNKDAEEKERISSEHNSEIPQEKFESDEAGIKHFPSESNYLDELHQNLLEQERKEKEFEKDNNEKGQQLERKVIDLGEEPHAFIPLQDGQEANPSDSEFKPLKFQTDQNVI